MSLSIKKSSKSGEVQRIINEEMERLGAVQGLNQMQLEERDNLLIQLKQNSNTSTRGLMGYDTKWVNTVNQLLAQGFDLRQRALKLGSRITNASGGLPLHTVEVTFSKGNYVLTTDLNDWSSGSGRSRMLEAEHENGTRMVLKQITNRSVHQWSEEFRAKRDRDIGLWASLTHENILPFLGTTQIGGYLYAVSTLAINGDFLHALREGTALPVIHILWKVATAVRFMHEQKTPLIHGDIKPENILLEANLNPLLSDFATMKRLDHTTTADRKREASAYLKSPELWRGNSRSIESDVYAFGINISWALLGGENPYPIPPSEVRMYDAIVVNCLRPQPPLEGLGTLSKQNAWTVAEKCWAEVPGNRPSMRDVVKELSSLVESEQRDCSL